MRALLIGGTGVISTSVTRRLCGLGWEVTLLNRGMHAELMENMPVRHLRGDIREEKRIMTLLRGEWFDTVCNFVAYTPADVARDIRLFRDRTEQYVFISSASAYQKPTLDLPICEDTPLDNPYWAYSRKKAACEGLLMQEYAASGFPVTIVRPSHTYCERSLPVQIHGSQGAWQVLSRMRQGKSVPVAGDGESLWTVTWAEDFAVYFCALLGNAAALGQAFHITSDEALTWNAIYRCIAAELGAQYRPVYLPAQALAQSQEYDLRGSLLGDKAYTTVFDNRKVRQVTGIGPIKFMPFAEGVKQSVARFLTCGDLQREDREFDAFCDRAEELAQHLTNAMRL